MKPDAGGLGSRDLVPNAEQTIASPNHVFSLETAIFDGFGHVESSSL